jgi:hypothetical protein
LIYYADFYDLKTILKHNWQHDLSKVFGKLKELEVLLDILEELRNPDAHNAHRRNLLQYQKHLAIGISGKIRTEITGYFSKMETGESYYPRIECVQDSLGNSWAIGEQNTLVTNKVLRPGDEIQFNVSATDPLGETIEFTIMPLSSTWEFEWKENGDFSLIIKKQYVGKIFWICIAVRSKREFHAMSDVCLGSVDDTVKFGYEVLPPKG